MSLADPYLERRLQQEVLNRKEAERLLEAKSLELRNKNMQLHDYSKQLEEALVRPAIRHAPFYRMCSGRAPRRSGSCSRT